MDVPGLIELLKANNEFVANFGKEFQLKLLSEKFNLVYMVEEQPNIYVKVGLRGWSRYEWEILNILHKKNYCVPEPIFFIPFKKHEKSNWNFGSLEQVDGVLVFRNLVGSDLWNSFSLQNLKRVIKLLNTIHEDESIKLPPIEEYQQAEVNRGLFYVKQLELGPIHDQIVKKLKKYSTQTFDSCFIHGDSSPDHFIFMNGKIGMLDLEAACMGDPLKDFGILIAELLNGRIPLPSVRDLIFPDSFPENTKERFEFFIVRRLLVKIKYQQSNQARKILEDIISNNLDIY